MSEPSASDLQALLLAGKPGKLRLSKVIPWDGNPRDHDPEQIRLLAKSIQAHGLVRPLLLQAGSNKLIAGHGTREAIRSLLEPGQDPEVSVVWSPLSDEKAASYAVADNRLSDLSTWNVPQLREVMAELDNGALDVEVTGFTSQALDALFSRPTRGGLQPGADPDAAPPLPETATSRLGDLYVLGSHRLLCGDSTDPAAWARLLDGQKIALLVTDPPYGVAYKSSAQGLKAGGKASIKNDELDPAALRLFLTAAFQAVAANLDRRAAAYVFYPSRFHREFEDSLNSAGLDVRAQIIWAKNAASFGFAQYKWKHEPVLLAAPMGEVPLIYVPAHETAFYAHVHGGAPTWEGDRAQTTVWSVARETGYVHPTQKPTELLKKPILNSSRPGMLVADAFGGSGSTLITCEMLGRPSATMELDPLFVDVIVRRWEEATGRSAVLIRE